MIENGRRAQRPKGPPGEPADGLQTSPEAASEKRERLRTGAICQTERSRSQSFHIPLPYGRRPEKKAIWARCPIWETPRSLPLESGRKKGIFPLTLVDARGIISDSPK